MEALLDADDFLFFAASGAGAGAGAELRLRVLGREEDMVVKVVVVRVFIVVKVVVARFIVVVAAIVAAPSWCILLPRMVGHGSLSLVRHAIAGSVLVNWIGFTNPVCPRQTMLSSAFIGGTPGGLQRIHS